MSLSNYSESKEEDAIETCKMSSTCEISDVRKAGSFSVGHPLVLQARPSLSSSPAHLAHPEVITLIQLSDPL